MMKILNALRSGISRTLAAWKGILIIWLVALLFVSLPAIPLKGTLKSALGNSMVTEKFSEGLNIDIIPDLGPAFFSFLSSFSSGLLMIILVGFLLNVFLAGGIFGILRANPVKFSASEFFRSASQNFSSFFVIMLIMSIIIVLLTLIILIFPSAIVSASESVSEKTVYMVLFISALVSAFILLILLSVSDYSRAWKACHSDGSGFRALGYGFGQAFRTFLHSFTLMLIVVVLQFLFALVAFCIIAVWRPESGGGIFLLFLVSQFLFFIKIVLRTLRYAGITSLMEIYGQKHSSTGQKSNDVINIDTDTSIPEYNI